MIAFGSQGDVQPFVALGTGFAARGHAVTVVTHESFRPLVEGRSLSFAAVAGNPIDIVRGAQGQAWLGSRNRSVRFLTSLSRLARGIFTRLARDAYAASRGCDLIIYSLPLSIAGYTIAESLGVPSIAAALYPLHPTGSSPSILMPNLAPRVAVTNRLSEELVVALYWRFIRPLHREWREGELARPPLPKGSPFRTFLAADAPFLYGYSPAIVPPASDWSARQRVCGYWYLEGEEGWQPPAGLLEFIEAGPPPLYVGFGSMASGDPERRTRIVLEALARTRQRAVLAAGWGGLRADDLPPSVHPVGFVPHGWLFPRMGGAVHHGGAGTTAALLRAGVPQVVVPFFADQFFWGRRIAELGLGAAPIPPRRLSAERLADAVHTLVEDDATRARCAAVARTISGEDGISAAVSAVEGYFERTTRRTMA